MFQKEYSQEEFSERAHIIKKELYKNCKKLDNFEFEYHWEFWGVNWAPWFIHINGESIDFSLKDIGSKDLDILIEKDVIELLEVFPNTDEVFGRRKFRLLKS